MRRLASRLRIGPLLLRAWHQPVGRLKESLRNGGPWEERRTERGRREMEAAAWTLPPVETGKVGEVELHFLSGRRYWYQAVFCLASFALAAKTTVKPVFHDDGSLDDEIFGALRRTFPLATRITEAEIEARLDEHLPATQFPRLRACRERMPLFRKILDPHVGSTGPKLLLDCDLLFFRQPSLIIEWLASPSRPLRATDIQNAYGYPLPLLNELAGCRVDERVNTGILGLRSEEFDWARMEAWCRGLIERQGAHYYQEQALVALHLAGRDAIAAPLGDYVTWPKPPEALACEAVMHHYVANSKRWYFQRNWRRFAPAQ